MKNFFKTLSQHKLQIGVALVVALGIIFALSTFAAAPKKVPNGQLTFWTHQLNQTPFTNVKVTFNCGGQQKTVNTGPNGKVGPFDVTGTAPKDTRECKIKVFPPANYELIPGNKPELTRSVKAGTKEIVNWTFRPIAKGEPEENESEDSKNPADACKDGEVLVITKEDADGTCVTKEDAEETKATPVPSPPDQVVIVPAEPDEGTSIDDLPDSAPAEEPVTNEPDFPPADEPVEDQPADTPTEEPTDDTDVGNVSGIGDDAEGTVATSDGSSSGGSGSSLSGGGSGSNASSDSDLPGIAPSPSAAVAAERGSIPAWQQWLLVIVVLGGIGALAYFGLKYYRENQV